MLKKTTILFLLLCFCIKLFCIEEIIIPQFIGFDIVNDKLADLLKYDNRIVEYQIIDMHKDKIKDLLVIYKIENPDSEEFNFIAYAIYENKGNQFTLIYKFVDTDPNNAYWGGTFVWGQNDEIGINDDYLIDLSKYNYENADSSKGYTSNVFFDDHFILMFAYPDYLDYHIMVINDNNIHLLSRVGAVRYIIENTQNINFIMDYDFYGSPDYNFIFLRTFKSHRYDKETGGIEKISSISKENSNTIYKYNLKIFTLEKTIDSLFELFFFSYYNMHEIVTKAWLNKMLLQVIIKDKRFIKLSDFMKKRLEYNDKKFYEYFKKYYGPFP